MSRRSSFLVRLDPQVLAAMRRWADDELRSVNGQIEYVLREALKRAGRLKDRTDDDSANGANDDSDLDGGADEEVGGQSDD
ncbi:MAG: Arc family DNA-binding protein [Planctomycetota bacterium]|nr:MAG: Arc family DNA-binding protein [Planctomycetota bacterium]